MVGVVLTDTYRKSILDEEQRKFDPRAHAVTVIAEPHRLIHDGFYYTMSVPFTALGAGADFEILAQVPAGVFPHFRIAQFFLGGGPARINFFEGATFSDAGAAITPINNNRNSANAAQTVWTSGPTITGDGTTLLDDQYAPSPGLFGVGQEVGDLAEEYVLAPSTDYLLRLTNNDPAAIDGSIYLAFYELDYPEDATAVG